MTGLPTASPRGLLVPGRHYLSRGLKTQRHLMPDKIGCSHSCPHMLDSRHLSAGIHPVAAWHSHSTKRTNIIIMITLTLDKRTLIKVGFSTKGSVHQGPEWSTPHQRSHPGGFAPSRKALPPTTARWDGATLIRKLCTLIHHP
jgi:hypothetical protein